MKPRLRMTGVRKAFGPTQALDGVNLEARRGEVHALIGENGAGKSTLMKILSGVHRADEGRMELDGKVFAPAHPRDALGCGVAMIYQELNLAPHLSVVDNLFLGRERRRRFGWVKAAEQRARCREVLKQIGREEIDPDTSVGELPLARQQMIEIARALLDAPAVLVMDEPTSSLGKSDVAALFDVIREVKKSGVAVVYISHFLEELVEIADGYTVLRDGKSVSTGAMKQEAIPGIIRSMVGRDLDEMYAARSGRRGERMLLKVGNFRGRSLPKEAGFELHEGEILGVAGLIGAGKTETLRALFGLDPAMAGELELEGVPLELAGSPRRRLREGFGYLSENRKEEGLMPGRSVMENVTLSHLRPFQRFGLLRPGPERRTAEKWIDRLQIRCRDPHQPVAELSGGNQQKAALVRLLHQEARILLLDEPTRGVDVGSKREIYRLIQALAEEGRAVVFVSAYLPELLGVCDRIAVVSRGVWAAVRDAADWTEESLMEAAIGGGRP